jgi:hypothetical protein
MLSNTLPGDKWASNRRKSMDTMASENRHNENRHNEDQQETTFAQTNLVSDGFVPAPTIDPNLINPWGVAHSPTGPFWVSDNGAGVATIYTGAGTPVKVAGHTSITIATPPGQGSPASPTGQVFNIAGNGFDISGWGEDSILNLYLRNRRRHHFRLEPSCE